MLLLFLLAVGGGLGAIRSVGEAVRNLM